MTKPVVPIEIPNHAECESAWDNFVKEWVEDAQSFSLEELRTAFIVGWKLASK